MLSISAILPALPGISPATTRAPWPVWRDSIAGAVRWVILSRKEASTRCRKARDWLRDLQRTGPHPRFVYRAARDIMEAMPHSFLNYTTGQLDPSYDGLAAKTGWCRSTIALALKLLRDLAVLSWQRRCTPDRDEHGHFRLRQCRNAYTLLPPSQWVGYRDKTEPPPPTPDTLGYPEPIPDPIEMAAAETLHGQRKAALAALEADPNDTLATALASFGRAIEAREAEGITGVREADRNPSPSLESSGDPDPMPSADDLDALKAWHVRQLFRSAGSG